jgi:hypothetical protein
MKKPNPIKVNPQQRIQRHRSAEELRKALKALPAPHEETDVDEPGVVLSDAVEELLEARQTLEQIRQFAQTWAPKLGLRL